MAGSGDARRTITQSIGGRGEANAESLNPRRYPFEVKTGKAGTSALIPVYTIPDAATPVNNFRP